MSKDDVTIDLAELDTSEKADKGAVMQVRDKAGKEVPGMTITLAGVDSDRYIKASRDRSDKRLSKMSKRTAANITSEEFEKDGVDILVAVTIGWTGFKLKGEELKCTPENVRMIYSNRGFAFLREQVDEFIADRKNF